MPWLMHAGMYYRDKLVCVGFIGTVASWDMYVAVKAADAGRLISTGMLACGVFIETAGGVWTACSQATGRPRRAWAAASGARAQYPWHLNDTKGEWLSRQQGLYCKQQESMQALHAHAHGETHSMSCPPGDRWLAGRRARR